MVGKRHVDLDRLALLHPRQCGDRLHRDDRGRHVGLEARLQRDRVVVLDLRRDDDPRVGDQLALDEDRRVRHVEHAGLDGVRGAVRLVLLGLDLQEVTSLGDGRRSGAEIRQRDNPGCVGDPLGNDDRVVEGVEQPDDGPGHLGAALGREREVVNDRHLHLAGQLGNGAELERHGEQELSAAVDGERAVVLLQRQIGGRIEHQRQHGLLARSQRRQVRLAGQGHPSDVRQHDLHGSRGRAAKVGDLEGDGRRPPAEHALLQIARARRQAGHQRHDRRVDQHVLAGASALVMCSRICPWASVASAAVSE